MRTLYYHYLISAFNNSTVFYATGIADSGTNPCITFRYLCSLLATQDSGVDSVYGFISLCSAEETRSALGKNTYVNIT